MLKVRMMYLYQTTIDNIDVISEIGGGNTIPIIIEEFLSDKLD